MPKPGTVGLGLTAHGTDLPLQMPGGALSLRAWLQHKPLASAHGHVSVRDIALSGGTLAPHEFGFYELTVAPAL